MGMENLEAGEIEALINELDVKMARLRAIYEQYFMGIERMPPHTLRKDVVRLIHRLENVYIRNTAVKFKLRSLIQRFNSYKAYWGRVERQIEEGTYVRDIRRAERNRERRRDAAQRGGRDGADDGVIELDMEEIVDLRELEVELVAMDTGGAFDRRAREPQIARSDAGSSSDNLDPAEREAIRRRKLAEIAGALGIDNAAAPAGEPAPRPQPSQPLPTRGAPVSAAAGAQRQSLADIKARMQARGAAPSAPSPAANAGGDDVARRVYNQLLEAKRRCNEPTDKLTYDSVAKSIARQREQIQSTRGGDVDFKVVIKDGRAFIKPESK